MFGLIKPSKISDTVTIDLLDTRKDGDQINFDILNVTTVDSDGDELTTYFGIQGRSDHLAKALRKRRESGDKLADASFTMDVDTNAIENDMPLQAVA